MNDSPSVSASSSPSRLPLIGGGAAVVVVIAIVFWWLGRGYESTDDAFIQADIAMIAPRVSGLVSAVRIDDNQRVKAGDALFEIDPPEFVSRVQQAEAGMATAQAAVASAQADLSITRTSAPANAEQARAAVRAIRAQAERAQADVARYESLYKKDEISRQTLDQTVATARALRAQVDQSVAQLAAAETAPQQTAAKEAALASAKAALLQAQVTLEQAHLQLSRTHVIAPADGVVTHKNVQVGAQVQAGNPVLALVGTTPWIIANFKETQLQHLRAGQPAEVRIDAYPGQVFHARVDSLQSGTGSAFSLLPAENASGNFVKVVQRVPVKLVFDPLPDAALHLVPGMSAVPKVDTHDQHGAPLRSSSP